MTWRNRHVIVDTTRGPKVLKQYRETSNPDTIAHEHSIVRHLNGRDFPSIRLDLTDTGESFVEVEGSLYSVLDYEPGRQYTATFMSTASRRGLTRAAARTLGRLHRELLGFRPDGRHHLGVDVRSGERERDLSWHLETLDRLVSGGSGNEHETEWLRARATVVRDALPRAADLLASADLPLTVIHGDYGLHNLLFRSSGTAVVHDFELSRLDWRLLDLAIVLERVSPGEREGFISGYRETNQLPPGELDLLPVIRRYHLLTGAVRSWDGHQRFGGHARLVSARTRLEAADDEEWR